MTDTVRPGAEFFYAMHGGADNHEKFAVYSEWDDVSETGVLADLTGATAKAQFNDSDGVLVFAALVTVDETNSTVEIQANKTLCTTHAGKEGGEWGLMITWASGRSLIEMYGGWEISKVLVS